MIEPTEPATNSRMDSPDEAENVSSTFPCHTEHWLIWIKEGLRSL
jgi:hypothetical protein